MSFEVLTGMFDGETPPSTSTIFDDNIFDTLVAVPIGVRPIVALFHGNEKIPTTFHGTEAIVVR